MELLLKDTFVNQDTWPSPKIVFNALTLITKNILGNLTNYENILGNLTNYEKYFGEPH